MKKIEIFLKLLTVLLLLGIYSITFAQTFEKNGIYYRNFKLNPDTISFHKENSLLQIQKSDSLSLPIIKNDFKVNTLDGNYGCEQRAVETAIDGYITDSLGWVYFKKGLYEKAVKYLEKAVSLVPNDPIILEHMGDAYLKISEKGKALQFYKRSLSNKKEDKGSLEKKIQELTGK